EEKRGSFSKSTIENGIRSTKKRGISIARSGEKVILAILKSTIKITQIIGEIDINPIYYQWKNGEGGIQITTQITIEEILKNLYYTVTKERRGKEVYLTT